ncbi:Serine/threonine-protein kinase PknB [Planctomycetes bacterium Poly30]|uniref:Serine/threonine-protein kinase PknB n=1 Tax=Saltatorellus ferox TaxID=2528018 RepID=A0A518EVF3_9BACT|nr:Serine/threonine-protein kinase PknB [Planctomycetes bacterium Poly30]
MTTNRTEEALHIFERVLDLDECERALLIEEACGGDDSLRREVVRMLDADSRAGFLDLDAASGSSAVPTLPASHREGETIGPFRIRRTLGSGGMGIVYEAEQQYPRRRVALKMLPASFVRPGAELRFRTEIELVARLDHPGVARVLQAGVHTSSSGVEQPYFAMEFVPGAQDLIAWGRERSQRERLEAFVLVCDAIQHGHQKGVVHRDLKPANVLVGETGIPKVIDFGVAHAVDGTGELHTRLTQAGEIVGTLQYMAPEQLDGSRKIDTRTDVYALGLLMYELMCGHAPYEFTGRSLTDIAMMIRDQPPRPIRESSETVPDEVGWIILRAVEKDPDRRYSSASELLADIQRFLDHRPVEAGKPGLGYTLAKFVRRHRVASAAAVLVLLSIVGGAGVALAAMVRANDEADRFRSINRVLTGMFEDVRVEDGGADIRAEELLDRAAERVGEFGDRPGLEADLRLTLLKSYSSLELHEPTVREARRTLELARELEPQDEIAAAYRLARGLAKLDRFGEAREVADRYLDEWLPAHPQIPPAAVYSMRHVSSLIARGEGKVREATQQLEALLVEVREEGGASTNLHSNVEMSLLQSLLDGGQYREAERLARRRLKRFDERGRSEHQWFLSRWLHAKSLHKLSRDDEAQEIMESLLSDVRELYGAEHERTRLLLHDLADVYIATAQERKAIPLLEELARVSEEHHGPTHSETLLVQASLARALAEIGEEEGVDLLREAVNTRAAMFGPGDPRTLESLFRLGRILRQSNRLDEAEPVLVELHERSLAVFTDADEPLHRGTAELGQLRLNQGRFAEASALLGVAWRGYQRHSGELAPVTLAVGNNYAGSLLEQELWEESSEVFIDVLSGIQRAVAPSDPRILACIINLATCHARRGEHRLALKRFADGLDWATEHLPQGNPRRLRLLDAVGSQLVELGRAEEAVALYRELMQSTELNPELEPLTRSEFRLGFANSLVAAGRFDEAVEELETLTEIEEARVGDPESAWLKELEAKREDARAKRDATAAKPRSQGG